MNILVIGNGFDLAHGLPTQYGDFLEYIKKFDEFKHQNICSCAKSKKDVEVFAHFVELENKNPGIISELQELSNNNLWIKYFTNIYESRKQEGKVGWIDFENEISTIIQALDSARITLNTQFRNGSPHGKLEQWQHNTLDPILSQDGKVRDCNMCSFNNTYIFNCKTVLYNDMVRLIRSLEIYLSCYISYEKCKKLKDISELQINYVLSFNYTMTYERLYALKIHEVGSNGIKQKSTIDCDYIHGKAKIDNSIETCNMIIGIDEYLHDGMEDTDNEFIQFKKFYQRIYKMTGCHYTDWLAHRNTRTWTGDESPGLEIHIYGHSLDVTDRDILRDLILADGAKTIIYYHNNDALGKLIANLVKVIGEKELIKRTDGQNRTIIFKKTSKETVS